VVELGQRVLGGGVIDEALGPLLERGRLGPERDGVAGYELGIGAVEVL
jgi:hypothetical protein